MATAIIYTKHSCSSSRKAIQFFKDNQIPYKEIKLSKERVIDKNHLLLALKNSDTGFCDLMKSTALKKVNNLTTKAAINLIEKDSDTIRSPFIIQGEKTQNGYSEEEFGKFLSKSQRRERLLEMII